MDSNKQSIGNAAGPTGLKGKMATLEDFIAMQVEVFGRYQ
jgi:hypothetical protein